MRFRRLVAFHEAGRTVIAWDAGLRLPRISIYPEEHTRGRILVGQDFPDGVDEADRRDIARLEAERYGNDDWTFRERRKPARS